MRITNNMMINTLMSNLERNMNRMSVYQDRLATGKQVIRASDDPVATSNILKFKSDIASLAQYEKNTGDSMAWMEVTESSIADVGTVLQRMRELAVQASNGTNTLDDTEKIAKEIEQLKLHLITDGNANFAGRYCFTGYQTDKPLFKDDGTYNIDITQNEIDNSPTLQYQVSIAQEIDVTTNGVDVFGYVPSTDAMATHFTNGSDIGTPATQAALSGTFDLNYDFSTVPGSLTIAIDGTNYTVPAADVAALNAAGTPIDKNDVLNLINSAAAPGPVTLNTVADVYFDQDDNLVLKSKLYGTGSSVQVTYGNPAHIAGFGLSTALVSGIPAGAATVSSVVPTLPTPPMNDAFIANPVNYAAIEGSRFYVTLNGERKAITVPTGFTATQAGLAAALNGELDTAFPPMGTVQASFVGDSLTFTTSAADPGKTPSLEIRPIMATQSQMMVDIDQFVAGLTGAGPASDVTGFLGKIDAHLNNVLSIRADIGARVNRMELVANRISDNSISFTKMLSDAQDANMAGVIMFLKNAENVYKAALSTGSKVIQPSLIDFLN